MAEQLLERETHRTIRSKSPVLRIVKWLVALIVLSGIAVAGYITWQNLSKAESTDDAQIDGTIVPISSRIAGYVTSVMVGDEQFVKGGEVLLQLDPRDYQVAVTRAQANLADAEAALQGARDTVPVASISTSSALDKAHSARSDAAVAVNWAEQQRGAAQARLGVAQANLRVARANQSKAEQDVARYKILVDKDEISKQT